MKKRNINKIYIFICVVIVLLVAVYLNRPTSSYTVFSMKPSRIPVPENTLGVEHISHGLLTSTGDVEVNGIFSVQEDSFFRFLDIGNYYESDYEYTIMAFNNYKKVPIIVDSKQYNDIVVKVEKNSCLQIPIEIEGLENGFNDIIYVIAIMPQDETDDRFRVINQDMHMLYHRINVFYEEVTVDSNVEFIELPESKSEPIPNIFIHKDKDLDLLLSIPLNEDIELNLTVGNPYTYSQNYALILMKDFNQIQFYNNQDVVYMHLNESSKVLIPFKVEYENNRSFSNLSAILIENPFEILGENSKIHNTVRTRIEYTGQDSEEN